MSLTSASSTFIIHKTIPCHSELFLHTLRAYCRELYKVLRFVRIKKNNQNCSQVDGNTDNSYLRFQFQIARTTWSLKTYKEEEWRRKWQPTSVLWPGKSHGQRSLVGCSPWGHEESDNTEWLHFHFSLSCTGEGNGNPLQCSCLENPRDGGAWWAVVYGVTESDTTEAI